MDRLFDFHVEHSDLRFISLGFEDNVIYDLLICNDQHLPGGPLVNGSIIILLL